MNVKRLNHAVLWVRDAQASAAFYRRRPRLPGRRGRPGRAGRVPARRRLGQPPRPRPVLRRRPPVAARRSRPGCTTWPGRSTRSRTSPPLADELRRARQRSSGRPTTACPRASTPRTPTASSSRSCGRSRRTSGATPSTPASSRSTSPPSSSPLGRRRHRLAWLRRQLTEDGAQRRLERRVGELVAVGLEHSGQHPLALEQEGVGPLAAEQQLAGRTPGPARRSGGAARRRACRRARRW